MTKPVPPAIAQLQAVLARAIADPTIATSDSRTKRLHETVSILTRAATDLQPAQLADLDALLHPDTIGHPDHDNTLLWRACAGHYRTQTGGTGPLARASQRKLMDGLADLNRAAARTPYWWEKRGARPWSGHTKTPLTPQSHHVLRQALAEPSTHPRWDPYRIRAAALVELLWATGCPPEGLAAANTTDLAKGNATIRLTVNPPGRTAAVVRTFPLDTHARAALRQWLPLRDHTVQQHTTARGRERTALFVTLHPAAAQQPDGTERIIPPGVRITEPGLRESYATWARNANARHHGQPGWPIPTTLLRLSRGGAIELDRRAQEAGAE